MTAFHYAHATGDDWRSIAADCLEQLGDVPAEANLGFLYITDLLSSKTKDILLYFKENTGIASWTGTVGVGICSTGQEYFDRPAIAVMLGEFPEDSFQVFSSINSTQIEHFCRQHESWYHTKFAVFSVVHGDARNNEVSEIVEQISDTLGGGFLVGGLSSSRTRHAQIANKVVEGGLSGVLFDQMIGVSTRLTQGCSPIGPRHEITEGRHNVIAKLDGEPALEVFKRDIGEVLARDLNKAAGYIFAALPIQGSDTGDYLVRNLVGADAEHSLLAIGEIVRPAMSVMFTRRDAETAREDMQKMLHAISKDLLEQPRGALYYSCLGRGENLFGSESQELKMIQDGLGDVPLVGFFANGEISHNRLYGYTGVLTLFK